MKNPQFQSRFRFFFELFLHFYEKKHPDQLNNELINSFYCPRCRPTPTPTSIKCTISMQKLVFSYKKKKEGKIIHLTQRLWALRDIFVQSKTRRKIKYGRRDEWNEHNKKKSSDSEWELHGRALWRKKVVGFFVVVWNVFEKTRTRSTELHA